MASAEQVGLNKTWELSLYELHRTPQDAITDNTEIAVSPRSLHSELMCPICLDMLKKTMTTKECLHRFCSDCIITALRSGNKVRAHNYAARKRHLLYIAHEAVAHFSRYRCNFILELYAFASVSAIFTERNNRIVLAVRISF